MRWGPEAEEADLLGRRRLGGQLQVVLGQALVGGDGVVAGEVPAVVLELEDHAGGHDHRQQDQDGVDEAQQHDGRGEPEEDRRERVEVGEGEVGEEAAVLAPA